MLGKSVLSLKKILRSRVKTLMCVLPNFARACGRVSVGRYPDKRPDSRQGVKKPRGSSEVQKSLDLRTERFGSEDFGKPGASSISLQRCLVEGDFTFCNRDWQPEANRRTPLST